MSTRDETILLAGGTGQLGSRILRRLLDKGYPVRLLVRPGRTPPVAGVELVEADLADARALDAAARGAAAVISALNGGPEVAVDGQLALLAAAQRQGVRRFIPSDYALDYFQLDYGDNVFLDYRKRVAEAVEASGIDHTFVLIGGFMENVVYRRLDFAKNRLAYWGSGDEPVDMTAIDDVARLVAEAIFDPRASNRRLTFAGEVVTTHGIAADYQAVTGRPLELQRMGSVDDLRQTIEKTKAAARSPLEYVFAQYAWAQLSQKGKLRTLMNEEYPQIRPLRLRDVMAQAATPSAGRFDAFYASGTPPWDIGRPQGAFLALAEAGALRGRVLDAGCGTGEHALMAAARGLEVTGIDAAARAIDSAITKAKSRGLTARFVVGDALELASLGGQFDTVLDCGLFHVFGDEERARYVESLGAAVAPGGRLFVLCFSELQPGTLGPRRVTQAELRAAFAAGWRVDTIDAARIETVDGSGAAAWCAALTRIRGLPSGSDPS